MINLLYSILITIDGKKFLAETIEIVYNIAVEA